MHSKSILTVLFSESEFPYVEFLSESMQQRRLRANNLYNAKIVLKEKMIEQLNRFKYSDCTRMTSSDA